MLLLLVVALLMSDYRRALNDRFNEKETALQEVAKTLLPGILHLNSHGRSTVQNYVDEVCGAIENENSPHHHIAVELNGNLIQAHAHHRQSEELVDAMKVAASKDEQRIQTADHDLVVGVRTQDAISVFVSEDVSRIRSQIFSDVVRRMWGLVLLGIVAAAIVNWLLTRMVARPLNSLVEKVRRISQSDFTSQLKSFGSRELDYLSSEINAMSDALEASESERKSRLNKARLIQENLLPKELKIPNISMGMVYSPAESVGGDYFDILPHGDDAWLICMADATDHGVPAAMTAAMLKTLLLQTKNIATAPSEILAQMNHVFMEANLCGDFASIILLRLDFKTKTLTYANAGHDPGWLLTDEGETHELISTGTLLGILEDEEWEEETIRLKEHCRLALATDGIPETFDVNENAFGKQRLLDLLLKNAGQSADDTAAAVLESVKVFRGEAKQSDDVTLLLLDLMPSAADTEKRIGPKSIGRMTADGFKSIPQTRSLSSG